MRWFGTEPWSPGCRETPQAPTPVGAACMWCQETIADGEDGVLMPVLSTRSGPDAPFEPKVHEEPLHAECHVRSIAGSYLHQLGMCCCKGAREPDPGVMAQVATLSRREEAILATVYLVHHSKPFRPPRCTKN